MLLNNAGLPNTTTTTNRYYVAMGAIIWQSSAVDGKLDPTQPDVTVGPIGASPEIGAGGVKVGDSAGLRPTVAPVSLP